MWWTLLLVLAAGEERPTPQCLHGPCGPGNDFCGAPFQNAPRFHLMDQHGCAENDPNGPVFDPVHGVIHHFYQMHLAAPGGRGPDYGHFVSKDFVHWAQMPVAIWNGLDASVWPPRKTPYDTTAIYTGSAVVVEGAGPGGKGPGIVQIYPGLCRKEEWPSCTTGTLLAQAVPADYAADALLTNWTKPSYNPVVEGTERDPSTPWKTAGGEWRLRTFDSMFYGAASDADLLAGRWYAIGRSEDFKQCECPSFYPLPGPTPGFEDAYRAAASASALPTHVHKFSCGGDWWQLGSYDAGAPKSAGRFQATPGWEDVFPRRRLDQGHYYASKDAEYPSRSGGKRRVNWGWATVPPASAQSLPREITFNAAVRRLEQAPLGELTALRGAAAYRKRNFELSAQGVEDLGLARGVAKHSEIVAIFELPMGATTFGLAVNNVTFSVDYSPPPKASVAFHEVRVSCAKMTDQLRLTPSERTLEIRIFADATFVEAYFQHGRVAMTQVVPLGDDARVALWSQSSLVVRSAEAYPMKSIWVQPEDVRRAPRVYPSVAADSAAAVFM